MKTFRIWYRSEYGLAISIKKAERKELIKLSKSERKGLIEIEEQ